MPYCAWVGCQARPEVRRKGGLVEMRFVLYLIIARPCMYIKVLLASGASSIGKWRGIFLFARLVIARERTISPNVTVGVYG